MFLLIPLAVTSKLADQIFFTFQYVSINTLTRILLRKIYLNFTFQYVSINTENDLVFLKNSFAFTFQYVSINTKTSLLEIKDFSPLHSNMFLLIQKSYF